MHHATRRTGRCPFAYDKWIACEPLAHVSRERIEGKRLLDLTVKAQVLLAETPGYAPPELARQRDVVADLGMRVERQVICEEVDVVLDKKRDAPPPDAGQPRVFAAPEVTVMDEKRVGTSGDGLFDQCERRSDAGDDGFNGTAAFHLQPVWAIISKSSDFQDTDRDRPRDLLAASVNILPRTHSSLRGHAQ